MASRLIVIYFPSALTLENKAPRRNSASACLVAMHIATQF